MIHCGPECEFMHGDGVLAGLFQALDDTTIQAISQGSNFKFFLAPSKFIMRVLSLYIRRAVQLHD